MCTETRTNRRCGFESLELRRLLTAQQFTPANIAIGASATFDVVYTALDDANVQGNSIKTTGVSLRMHYDSSEISPKVDAIIASALAGATIQDQADSSNFDNDVSTDRFVNFLWFDFEGKFPVGSVLPLTLFKASFDPVNTFAGTTDVKFTGNPPIGFELRSTPATLNFASTGPTLDFGDAPAGYPVSLADDGARHSVGSLFLGSSVDAELDGTNSAAANHDDNLGADEDGVFSNSTFISTTVPTIASFQVVASGAGKLDGWIDFNADGDWLDSGEQVFISKNVLPGENLLSFTIPAGAAAGSTGARFRLSTAGGLAPTGLATNGEVEDYLIEIVTGSASAVLNVHLPGGDTSVMVEGDSLVVRKESVVISKVPFASFGSLKLGGSSLDDIFELTILEALASKTLEFDGGIGKDILKLLEAGRTLDLTSANVTLRDIEGIDIAGSGNRLVISVDAVKAASSTTDTLEVVAKLGDTIAFGSGWRIETPKFINGQFTHLISESATGGTAKVEIRNDRPLTNPLNPFDANRDGNIQPLDALRIINEVRRRGAGPVVIPTSDSEINRLYFDVNGDMRLTALDALRVINAISRINHGLRASGESTTPFTSAPDKVHAQLDVKSEAYTPDMMSILAKAPLPRQQTFVSANMGLNRIDEFHYEYGLSDEGDKSKSTPTDLSSLKPSTLQN